ncbi:MAG: zinc-ribbon domain-containing protein [Alphaproteobacteria bacterium]|nr:zinc-ribbon domain-containing protein [Alphaproteobacteria bacterium]
MKMFVKRLVDLNNLATTHPDIIKQWDYKKNGIKPEELSHGSSKIVWWKCSKGHSYQMAVYRKTSRGFKSCPICSGHLTVPGVNDFETCYPEIANEWHPTKNGDLLPSQVSKKNGRKVWWVCQYGHEWQAAIRDRVTDKTGCPKCRFRRLTSFPEQAIYYYVKQLYPDTINRYKEIFENGMELDIYVPSIRVGIEFDGAAWHNTEEMHQKERKKYQICQKNNIKLIRVKERTGNEWWDVSDVTYTLHDRRNKRDLETVIQVILDWMDPVSNMWTRIRLNDCHSKVHVNIKRDENAIREYLSPIANSLAELRPDLVKDWNYEKNGNLKPTMFGINSNDYVWWKCAKCGHEWRTSIIQRGGKRESGCPECSKEKRGKTFTKGKVEERGSLEENNSELAKQWNPTKNGDLKPSDITVKYNKKVWWLCPQCGYEWQASPNNRSKGVGCPCCSGRVPKVGINDLKTLRPDLAEEWNYEKNGELRPENFLPKSGKRVWWRCKTCGHEWCTTINHRYYGTGCPKYNEH